MSNAIARLHTLGQSPWYDNITRTLLDSGELKQMLATDGIRGITSNPTIFDKAISGTDAYDTQLAELHAGGAATDTAFWELAIDDIGRTADVLRPVFDEAKGGDGFVSIEVAPDRAHELDTTMQQVGWLWERLDRPNILVKIPATIEGMSAVQEAIAGGFSVNVTLIFSIERYQQVIDAYFAGLERLLASGGDPSKVASVASFFVSRVDTEIDRRLPEGHDLRGRSAVANAKLAYELFRARTAEDRWVQLAHQGARLQRPLWASTSTKNPAYSDTLYVDELVGPDTVNTLAQGSIDALRDHGDPQPDTLSQGLDEAHAVIAGLADAGVDYADVTDTLEREGVASFTQSYLDVLATLEKRAEELTR